MGKGVSTQWFRGILGEAGFFFNGGTELQERGEVWDPWKRGLQKEKIKFLKKTYQ